MVTESKHNWTNAKREGTERRRRNRKEIITETGLAPRNQRLTIVIGMILKLRFGFPQVAFIL